MKVSVKARRTLTLLTFEYSLVARQVALGSIKLVICSHAVIVEESAKRLDKSWTSYVEI